MKIKQILFTAKATVTIISILLCWAGYLLTSAIDGTAEAFLIGRILVAIITIIVGDKVMTAAILNDGNDDEDGEKK